MLLRCPGLGVSTAFGQVIKGPAPLQQGIKSSLASTIIPPGRNAGKGSFTTNAVEFFSPAHTSLQEPRGNFRLRNRVPVWASSTYTRCSFHFRMVLKVEIYFFIEK